MNEEFVIKKGVLEEYNGTDEVVTVPEGVHVIGYGAFQPNLEMDGEAERLKKVILPETVWRIAENAFWFCYGLKEVELPSSLEVIGRGAFEYCDLKQINLPDGLISIEERAFGCGGSFEQVIIPPSVKRLDPLAFDGCTIKHILVPEHLRGAIENQKNRSSTRDTNQNEEWYDNIEWYDAKQNVETSPEIKPNYNENEFWIENDRLSVYCGVDETVVVPEGVRVIGKHAFAWKWRYVEEDEGYYVKNKLKEVMKEVKLPAGLEVIEKEAFMECDNLERVEMPETLKEIGERAFFGCYSLKKIELPEGLKIIGESAFADCEWIDELVIPLSVRCFGKDIFSECWVTRVIMPEYLEYADICLFPGRAEADEVITYSEIPQFSIEEDGTLVGYDGPGGEVIIPDGVVRVEKEFLLSRRPAVRRLVLPDTVTSIGKRSFSSLALKELTIPSSVSEIGEEAFWKCEKLKALHISEGVIHIEAGAFKECSALEEVTIPASVTTLGDEIFAGCVSLKHIRIPSHLKKQVKELENMFSGCSALMPNCIEWYGKDIYTKVVNKVRGWLK